MRTVYVITVTEEGREIIKMLNRANNVTNDIFFNGDPTNESLLFISNMMECKHYGDTAAANAELHSYAAICFRQFFLKDTGAALLVNRFLQVEPLVIFED